MVVASAKAEMCETARADVKSGQSVCDKNCFQCRFSDCIYDGMEYDDYVQSAALDKELTQTAHQKKVAAQKRAYYEANKDKVAAYQRAYREANKDKVAAQHRAYYEANKDKVAAQHRAYYERKKKE